MIPPDKSHVKIVMRNNTVVEGIVEEWLANFIKLQSLDQKSYVLILHPHEDIMLVKVLLDEKVEEIEEVVKLPPEQVKTELEHKFQEVYEQPSGNPLRDKSLAELKGMMAEQERQIIVNKLKSHVIGDTKKVKYEYPGLIKKPRTK